MRGPKQGHEAIVELKIKEIRSGASILTSKRLRRKQSWAQGERHQPPATAIEEAASSSSIAEFFELLGLARQAARDAYPDVQIVLAGMGIMDMFDAFPTPEEVGR